MNDADRPQDDGWSDRRVVARLLPTLSLVIALTAAAFATGLVGCGFGTYPDNGSAEPGPWWPWVCADGGGPVPDGGCPPPPCADAAADSCPEDGGTDGTP